jgi:hypothetical protein
MTQTKAYSEAKSDWVTGDLFGIDMPAHGAALHQGGEAFLTRAFRRSGALAADNSVTRIVHFAEWRGGSTGRKAQLSVSYEKPAPGLHDDLFVKFSRDFDDELRDHAKVQMQSEIHFAALSRAADFPVAVPVCLFADHHAASGTGILITERIAFGEGNIERHYEKCLDYEIADQVAHYRALVRELARLAGTHKGGRLPDGFADRFPFDPEGLSVSTRAPYTDTQLRTRIARLVEFAPRHPHLLAPGLDDPAFLARFAQEAPNVWQQQAAIKQFLSSDPRLIALCHWNANIDNAWFFRNEHGEVACGLMDWGHVSQMNMAMSLWGALSAAEISLWDDHFDTLLALFDAQYRACGAPAIDMAELRLHLWLYVALMGLTWMLDVPALLQKRVPHLETVENRFDERIKGNEQVRTRLHMMNVFLHLWQAKDFGAQLREFMTRV